MKSRSRKDYVPADDYYTPAWLFEKLNLRFDLDVAAPKGGIPWIPAAAHFSIEDDGLIQEWHGRVWMNPPYSNPTPWIDKFLAHGNGIALIQTSKSNAFIRMWNECDGIMYLPRNIMFQHITEGTKGIFMPVALFIMGQENIEAVQAAEINKVRI